MGIVGVGEGLETWKRRREGMEHRERRMEMNIMLHDRRVQHVSCEGVDCAATTPNLTHSRGPILIRTSQLGSYEPLYI